MPQAQCVALHCIIHCRRADGVPVDFELQEQVLVLQTENTLVRVTSTTITNEERIGVELQEQPL